jgi:hypothetical protein
MLQTALHLRPEVHVERSERRLAQIALAFLSLWGAGCSDNQDGDKGTEDRSVYKLERNGANVEVTPAYQECETDKDCTLVNITCNGCCEREAIQSSLEGEFEDAKKLACEGYQGPQCDCQELPETAACTAGRCEAVLEPDPYALERKDEYIQLTPNYTACSKDDECALVHVTCNACCTREAIATTLVSTFGEQKELACSDYEGSVCSCEEVPLNPVCEDGHCKAQDSCALLVGSYESNEKGECGLGENGVVLCNWRLTFEADGRFEWLHSDYGEDGTYSCERGRITSSNSSEPGEIRADGSVTFLGVAYHRI